MLRSRRTFGRSKLAAVGAFALALAVLAACGGSGSSDKPASSGGSSDGGSSSGSKNLSITAAVNVPATIDPDPVAQVSLATPIIQFAGTLFSYFNVGTKPDVTIDDIRNDLAETATPSADGLTWTIKLRSGIKSSAGNPLTTADVKWTFDRMLAQKANGYLALQRINADLTNLYTIQDDLTFQIHLTAPSPLFKQTLGGSGMAIIDSDLVARSAAADDPWGTHWLDTHSASFGPYDVQTFIPSQKLIYVASPTYWQGLPDVTTATFVPFTDPTQKLQSVLSGDLDLAMSMGTKDKAQFTASSKATFYGGYGSSLYYIAFDQTSPKMQDRDFRLAISDAVDRSALTTVAYSGLAKPVTSCMPTAWGVQDTKTYQTGADVAGAKKLLAGVPDKTFSLGISTQAAESSDVIRLLTANFAAAGITVDIQTYASATTFAADQASHKLDAWLVGRFPAIPDAGFYWNTFFKSNSPQNTYGYADPTLDANVTKIMSTTGDARDKLIDQTCTLFNQDLPVAPLFSIGTFTAQSKEITNGQNYPDSAIRIYNLKAA